MEKNNEIKHKYVETFVEDMAKVIQEDKAGLIKKIIHSEEEHEKEKINLSPESKKNKFFMLMGFVFILLGFFTFFYFLLNRTAPTVPVEQQFIPLIFNDKSSFLEIKDLKKDEIAQTVLNEVNNSDVKIGGIEGMYLTSDKKVIGLRDFLTLIKSNFVIDSDENLVSDNFLMGVVNSDATSQGKSFFILIKVRSITDIFGSLRAWENKMFSDLHGFFGVDISSETNYLLTKDFSDGFIENKNARILYDKDNKIVMAYILANDNSVIITNSENATQEIILRLAAGQIKK